MKTYFVSDFHFGSHARLKSNEREKIVVKWLDTVSQDAERIYLVGDVFDFFFEYKTVIPKGYSRFFGKLAELTDGGLPIEFFIGNHDMWLFRYFEDEFGIPIHREPIIRNIGNKTFYIGHGDGLGPGDYGYKFIKKIFANPTCQWLFERVHPNFGIGLANYWSGRSRDAQKEDVGIFFGEEKEWLLQYANQKLETLDADFFVFGHRHLPIDWVLKNQKSRYINLGEWLTQQTYGYFDGTEFKLQAFENETVKIYKNY